MNKCNNSGIDFPLIPEELLEELNKRFPDRCPSLLDDERLIWFKAGQRSVVDVLKDQHRRQKETSKSVGLDGLYLEEDGEG